MFFASRDAKRFELQTDRLILRLARHKDWQSWREARVSSYALLQSVEPTWYPHMHDYAAFRRAIHFARALYRSRKARRCVLIEKKTGKVIGGVALNRLEWGAKRCGLVSYWLAVSHHRQGLMFEGLQRLIDFAFAEMKLHRVEAEVLPDNVASKMLLLKLGFRYESTARKLIQIQGQWRDHDRYALINPADSSSV